MLLFWAVGACAVIAVTVQAALDLRQQALGRAERSVQNLASLLSEQTATAMQAVYATLRGTADRLGVEHEGGFPRDERAVHTLLRARAEGMPQIRSLSVIDAGGSLLSTSLIYPTPGLLMADREYFIFHRDHAGRGLFIDQPSHVRPDAGWLVRVSRRVDGVEDSFHGVIVAAVDPAYFERIYRTIELGTGGSIRLFREDGFLLAGWPRPADAAGHRVAGWPASRAAGALGKASLPGEGAEIHAWVESAQLPLLTAVTMSRDTVLAPWRAQARLLALTAALLILLLATVSLALARQLAREERLAARLRRARAGLRELAAALNETRETERIRIARELHDELGQYLTGLKMDLAWIEGRLTDEDQPALRKKVRAMKAVAEAALKTVRRIAGELRPLVLDDLGLVAGLEWLAQDFSWRTGIDVTLQADSGGVVPSAAQTSALFRILQESLTNVARHARATRVQVGFAWAGGRLVLTVQDNGTGVGAAGSGPEGHSAGLGLLGIRERALMLGGWAAITSRPGQGSRVEVRLPCPHLADMPAGQ